MFQRLHESHAVAASWSHEESSNGWTHVRDLAMAAWAKGAGAPWHAARQLGVIRGLIRVTAGPAPGTATRPNRSRGRRRCFRLSTAIGQPTSGHPASLGLEPGSCPRRQPGGQTADPAYLESFLAERGRGHCHHMPSPIMAFKASSHLSPCLMRSFTRPGFAPGPRVMRHPPECRSHANGA